MRPIEFNGSIGRTNDMSQFKQQEDVKPQVDQHNMMQTQEHRAENESRQVNEQHNTDKNEFDAKHGGRGSYEDQRDKRRKKKIEEEGIVKVKSSARFDIKI